MKNADDNIVLVKSYNFALRCVKLYEFLCNGNGNYVIGKQLLKSGTNIGANVREAIRAQSKLDFVSKINISLKEASETEYWINLLRDSEYLSDKQAESLLCDCIELIKLLTSIIKSSRSTM